MKWNLLSQNTPIEIEEIVQTILRNRQIENIQEFLSPKYPYDITLEEVGIDPVAMRLAVDRIWLAKDRQEKIIVYGDYDCDGVCATAVLWETLNLIGCKALPFIPHREKHGYGLSTKSLDEIFAKGKPDLIISVDNGIVAHSEWQRIKDEGIFGILTDHHQSDGKTPPAELVIHSTSLCGTTVAWMLARELARKLEENGKEKIESLLDLCAVATFADQVPLSGANRSFAKHGLSTLNQTKRVGLELIMDTAGLKKGEVNSQAVNFGIAPRINAMGRLEHALDALRAICTVNRERSRALISQLNEVNQNRQDMTHELLAHALEKSQLWSDKKVIIVAHESYHEGIIGLIASKLTETYYKPSICIAIGKESSKASCRSVAGVNITDLLREIKSDLMEVGGHPMAAGFRVRTDNIETMRANFERLCQDKIDPNLLEPKLDVELEVPSSLVAIELAESLNTLEPFGAMNRSPLFLIKDLVIISSRVVGKEGKHLSLRLGNSDNPGQSYNAIGFGMGSRLPELDGKERIDVVAGIEINEWQGRRNVQLILKDLKV